MQSEQQLRDRLEHYVNDSSRNLSRDAQRGLDYAEKLKGVAKRDVMRHYLYKIERSIHPRNTSKPEYEGRVLDETSCNVSNCTNYTIIDVTSFHGNRIQADLIDATTID